MNLSETAVAKKVRIFGLEVCWWGFRDWYKWRWHRTHIDLGPVSIYGIEHPRLWLPLAWAIKPMRWAYHRWGIDLEKNQEALERLEKQIEISQAWKRL